MSKTNSSAAARCCCVYWLLMGGLRGFGLLGSIIPRFLRPEPLLGLRYLFVGHPAVPQLEAHLKRLWHAAPNAKPEQPILQFVDWEGIGLDAGAVDVGVVGVSHATA